MHSGNREWPKKRKAVHGVLQIRRVEETQEILGRMRMFVCHFTGFPMYTLECSGREMCMHVYADYSRTSPLKTTAGEIQ